MRRLLIPLALAALVVGTARTPLRVAAAPLPVRTFAADEVVLRWQNLGGFGGLHMPLFTLYGDGRVMTPPPAFPVTTLTLAYVSRDDVSRIADEAAAAGVDAERDYGPSSDPGGDAGTDVFTLRSRNGFVRRAVPGLVDYFRPDQTPAQVAARRRLLAFRERLSHPREWLGDRLSPEVPFVPSEMRVMGSPWPATYTPKETRAWHGPPIPPDPLHGCFVLGRGEIATVLPEVMDAKPDVRWAAGRTYWRLYFRAYYPDESGCV